MKQRPNVRATGQVAAKGTGALSVAEVAGAAAVVGARANAPLKLLVPRHRGAAVWAYASTLGGGLLAGDHVHLDLEIGSTNH